jgi:hypothetical protein
MLVLRGTSAQELRMEFAMKKWLCSVLISVFVFSLCAFAVEGKARINFNNPVQVAGKQLKKGDYKLTWTTTGDDAQVTLTSSDKKTVVTAAAKIVSGQKADSDSIVLTTDRVLKEIRLAGKAETLVF